MPGGTTGVSTLVFFVSTTGDMESPSAARAEEQLTLKTPNQPQHIPLKKRGFPPWTPAGGAELVPQARPLQEGLGMRPDVLEISDEVEVGEELVEPEV